MNELWTGDCLELFPKVPDQSVDLVFVDPPFNIGHIYDVYSDDKTAAEYVAWSERWGREVLRVLKPNGTFWLAIGDAFASDLDVLFRRTLGFHRRSWCVWHFTFGVNSVRKFTPSHTHLLHYVVDPKDFTFNADAVKVPSARQAVYGDKRAKAGGRLPNDVWALRPGEHPNLFPPGCSDWLQSRVCGTFKERVQHPAQMPLPILERIVAVSSNPGDLVLDPMCGSGVTLLAAKRLGRHYLGMELSPGYVSVTQKRLFQEPVSENLIKVQV